MQYTVCVLWGEGVRGRQDDSRINAAVDEAATRLAFLQLKLAQRLGTPRGVALSLLTDYCFYYYSIGARARVEQDLELTVAETTPNALCHQGRGGNADSKIHRKDTANFKTPCQVNHARAHRNI
jgi:hypothetical protein